MNKLAILTSGGDAPGMNAAVRAATMFAHAGGAAVVGVDQGYRGLVEGHMRPLGPSDVAAIGREGGTVLGSARAPEFERPEVRDAARRRLAEAGVDALVVVGGNGSLTGMHALLHDPGAAGLVAVGVPASIDNDVGLTGLSIGVDTAMNTIVDACDRISDTASAHDRAFIVEVMGRHCGYLAMTAGVAASADTVLFPEAERSEEALVASLVKTIRAAQRREGRRRVLILKAEGIDTPTERLRDLVDAALRADGTEAPPIETRYTVLGHVVRGGRPSAFDRLLAGRLAHAAYRALAAGDSDVMAAWMVPGDTQSPAVRVSPADPYCRLVDMDAVLAETARLLDGTSPIARWRRHVFADIEHVLGGWEAS